jgi:transcriptional regulator with XRE-family HTH domain
MPRANIEPYMVTGGLRLRGRRTDLGLSMEEVAEACGVHRATVSKWERGKSNPMRQHISRKLAEVLKLKSLSALYVDGRTEGVG